MSFTVFEAYDGEIFSTKEAAQEYCADKPYRLGLMGWKEKKVNSPALQSSEEPSNPMSGNELNVSVAAEMYVSEKGFEHSGGIIEKAFEAGARWALQGGKPTSGNELNVSVKPLEWFDIEQAFRAETILGPYEIMPHDFQWAATGLSTGSNLFGGPSEAKAAAQADYEQRILSALSPQPVAKPAMGGGWMTIETAPKDGTDIILGAIPQIFEGKPVQARSTVGHWTSEEECQIDIGDCGGSGHCREYEYRDPYWLSWDGGFTDENPATHWMPLPAPPAATGGEEL
jgi:hypothetical protein